MLRIYDRIGAEVEVLGKTELGGCKVYLGAFHVSRAHLEKIKARLPA